MADILNNRNATRRAFLRSAAGASVALALSRISPASAGDHRKGFSVPPNDIAALSAVQLSRAIRAGAVSCREVMEAYLTRIETFGAAFNAIVSLQDRELLVREARKRDDELARGMYRGWMHGFPHAVKDLADTAGIRTTRGSPVFADHIPDADAIFVERLKGAGAIIIGKTNVPEFGLGSQTYNPVYGTTFNAYDAGCTAGGSSGGAAAALALRLVPVADGSDMMGSLRNPAAFNNVVGFRPTLGLVPTGSNFLQQLACLGPMGRTVEDTAMLLSTMAGHDRRSPLSLTRDPAIFAQPLDEDVTGTRIGWLGDFDGYLPMEEGVLELCEQSLRVFEQLGCSIEHAKVDYPMEKLWNTWLTHRHWTIQGAMSALYDDPGTRRKLKPELIWEIEGGLGISGRDIFHASVARSEWYDALLAAFEKHDFLALPAAQVFPFPATVHWPTGISGRTMDTYHRWMEVAIPGTLSGGPTISVPAGFGAGNLPMGIQIIGPVHSDLRVLKLAHAYEQAADWNVNPPPLVRTDGTSPPGP